jgi:hypothetical protein
VDGAPSFQKSFLSEIPSIMLIAHNTVDHGENLDAVPVGQTLQYPRFGIDGSAQHLRIAARL